jgi:hypothetical protein
VKNSKKIEFHNTLRPGQNCNMSKIPFFIVIDDLPPRRTCLSEDMEIPQSEFIIYASSGEEDSDSEESSSTPISASNTSKQSSVSSKMMEEIKSSGAQKKSKKKKKGVLPEVWGAVKDVTYFWCICNFRKIL